MKFKKTIFLLTPLILQGIFTPLHSDTRKDIEDLKQLIKSTGTKVIDSSNCKKGELGHYTFRNETDKLVICTNNIDKNDNSAYWEVLAHESAHIMQACNNNNLYKDQYHPRMFRKLKTEAPHYSEILKQYRGQDKIRELEAFDMELKTPEMVKEDFEFYCISDRSSTESTGLSQKQVDELQGLVGGEENYNLILTWAENNLTSEEVNEFDNIMETGNVERITKAILGLNKEFELSKTPSNNSKNQIEKSDIDFYFKRSLKRMDESNYKKALADLNKVLKLDPNNADAYYNRGTIKSRYLKEYKAAILDFNKVIEIDPTYTSALHNRGKAKTYLKDYSGAITDFNKVISQKPLHLNARQNRANIHYFNGDYYFAILDYKKALSLQKDIRTKAFLYKFIGLSKEKLDDKKGACSSWKKASSLVGKAAQDDLGLPELIQSNCK